MKIASRFKTRFSFRLPTLSAAISRRGGVMSLGVIFSAISLSAAEVDWREPFDVAKEEAKNTGKPMLAFVGNTESCPDCQEFAKKVCEDPEFIAFANKNLVSTRLLYSSVAPKDEQYQMTRIADKFNMTPRGHAVIITNSNGVRIGELSTSVTSIGSFISDHGCPVITQTNSIGYSLDYPRFCGLIP